MKNIQIQNNKLIFSDGDFKLADNIELIQQEIIIALNTFYCDWILDPAKGIDYTGGLRNLAFLEADIKKQILEVNNVKSIDKLEILLNRETLSINVSAVIRTEFGNIKISETFTGET